MVASSSGIVHTLFDFTRSDQVNNWTEASDTVKPSGMSKATLVLQKAQSFQRAVLFTLLNPKPNGSSFAAIRCDVNFDLSECQNLSVKCRGQGVNLRYKILLRHKTLGPDSLIYGQVFSAPEVEFGVVKLLLTDFKPYYRGQELSLESHPLDTAAIISIGFKIDCGTYLPENRPGCSVLEIDWIKGTK